MITADIQNAAEQLGQHLRRCPQVERYLRAVSACLADPLAVDLEKRLYALYESLVARQEQGEVLSRDEVTFFNDLKRQVYSHPLILEREQALVAVKELFATAADELNYALGLDFVTLALAGEKGAEQS